MQSDISYKRVLGLYPYQKGRGLIHKDSHVALYYFLEHKNLCYCLQGVFSSVEMGRGVSTPQRKGDGGE